MDTRDDQDHPGSLGEKTPSVILIVDDELVIRDIVSYVLSDEGYQVIEAASGEAALALMEHNQPDLILSDVMMPGMDGFDFCRQVRATAKWVHIPFIFLTAKDMRSDIRQGMALGADDYLGKPFDADELLSAVRARLARAADTQAVISQATEGLRDSILRTLTHEFRTPLFLVVGYTDLLETGAQTANNEQFLEFLQGLRSGVARLNSLVEDFLLLNKLETGFLARDSQKAPREVIDPDKVVREVIAELAEQGQAANVQMVLQADAPAATVAAQEADLSGIVGRLLDNAIKFSKPAGGQVRLTTRCDDARWVLEVADDGIGMRPETLEGIFEAFRQIDRPRMEQQGAGLGLAIVRGLVQLYGGQVAVTSEPGRGSTFTVWLPLVKG
jgi:two-component system sensor histidine kinase/response regulator